MIRKFCLTTFLLIACLISAQNAVEHFMANPELKHANISLMVKDLTTNKVVASYRSDAITPCASVMKVITTATALELFGADYRYKTLIETDGETDAAGVLHGNVYIKGSGDPSLGSQQLGNTAFLNTWCRKLKEKGIKKIDGAVIADISAFDDEYINPFWIWEDIGNYYAPGVFAIAYCDNRMNITLVANGEGKPVTVEKVSPQIDSIRFENNITCTGQLPTTDIFVRGLPLSNTRYLSGNASTSSSRLSISGDIPNPALLLASDFTKALKTTGITVSKPAAYTQIADTSKHEVLHTHSSMPLSDIITYTNFRSDNMYAEHIFRLIGTKGVKTSSRKNASDVINNYWRSRVAGMQYNKIVDGSGLSPIDRLSAESLVDLLAYMTNSRYKETFLNSLPQAGVEGTVRSFLRDTPLQGKAHIKSGTTSHIKSYAGYAQGPSGHKYAFAVLVADPACRVKYVQDMIELLLTGVCK